MQQADVQVVNARGQDHGQGARAHFNRRRQRREARNHQHQRPINGVRADPDDHHRREPGAQRNFMVENHINDFVEEVENLAADELAEERLARQPDNVGELVEIIEAEVLLEKKVYVKLQTECCYYVPYFRELADFFGFYQAPEDYEPILFNRSYEHRQLGYTHYKRVMVSSKLALRLEQHSLRAMKNSEYAIQSLLHLVDNWSSDGGMVDAQIRLNTVFWWKNQLEILAVQNKMFVSAPGLSKA